MSVITDKAQGRRTLITKGALENILNICSRVQVGDQINPLDAARRTEIEQRYSEWSGKGFRVLGVATKEIEIRTDSYKRAEENELTFIGFLLFFDPPKVDVQQTIVDLASGEYSLRLSPAIMKKLRGM